MFTATLDPSQLQAPAFVHVRDDFGRDLYKKRWHGAIDLQSIQSWTNQITSSKGWGQPQRILDADGCDLDRENPYRGGDIIIVMKGEAPEGDREGATAPQQQGIAGVSSPTSDLLSPAGNATSPQSHFTEGTQPLSSPVMSPLGNMQNMPSSPPMLGKPLSPAAQPAHFDLPEIQRYTTAMTQGYQSAYVAAGSLQTKRLDLQIAGDNSAKSLRDIWTQLQEATAPLDNTDKQAHLQWWDEVVGSAFKGMTFRGNKATDAAGKHRVDCTWFPSGFADHGGLFANAVIIGEIQGDLNNEDQFRTGKGRALVHGFQTLEAQTITGRKMVYSLLSDTRTLIMYRLVAQGTNDAIVYESTPLNLFAPDGPPTYGFQVLYWLLSQEISLLGWTRPVFQLSIGNNEHTVGPVLSYSKTCVTFSLIDKETNEPGYVVKLAEDSLAEEFHNLYKINVNNSNYVVKCIKGGTLSNSWKFLVMSPVGVPVDYLTFNEAVAAYQQLSKQIQMLHEMGWCHNDVCPQHILKTDDGYALLGHDLACPQGSEVQLAAPDRWIYVADAIAEHVAKSLEFMVFPEYDWFALRNSLAYMTLGLDPNSNWQLGTSDDSLRASCMKLANELFGAPTFPITGKQQSTPAPPPRGPSPGFNNPTSGASPNNPSNNPTTGSNHPLAQLGSSYPTKPVNPMSAYSINSLLNPGALLGARFASPAARPTSPLKGGMGVQGLSYQNWYNPATAANNMFGGYGAFGGSLVNNNQWGGLGYGSSTNYSQFQYPTNILPSGNTAGHGQATPPTSSASSAINSNPMVSLPQVPMFGAPSAASNIAPNFAAPQWGSSFTNPLAAAAAANPAAGPAPTNASSTAPTQPM